MVLIARDMMRGGGSFSYAGGSGLDAFHYGIVAKRLVPVYVTLVSRQR